MRPHKKLRLLLFDANIVIKLHELGLLSRVVETCEVTLASSVVGESQFVNQGDERDYIDLQAWVDNKVIKVVTMSLNDVTAFRAQFKPTYFDRLDVGEAESLAFLFKSGEDYRIVSADTIVWKVLGATGRREQGLSLEELLREAGETAQLDPQYTKAVRERWTKQGFDDHMTGSALK